MSANFREPLVRGSRSPLSYAATTGPARKGFGWKIAPISGIWRSSSIFVVGKEYMRTGTPNISTHIQIVNALKRGIGSHANARHFYDMLTVVGTVPPPRVMAIAEKDSLLLRKVFNVIIYGRGCQQAPPPSWMVAGPWFATVRMPGAYPMFFALVPVVVDDERSSFSHVRAGMCSGLFHAPYPRTEEVRRMARAREVAMDSLKINSDFADSVRTVRLPVWDALISRTIPYHNRRGFGEEMFIILPLTAKSYGWYHSAERTALRSLFAGIGEESRGPS